MRSSRPRVLLVDDEPVIHELVAAVLDDVEIVSCVRGDEAIERVRGGERLDVALIDKNLPDRSGIEVIRTLKTLAPDLEILVLTGFPSFDSALEAISLGAFDYLIKPLRDVNDLRLRVGNALERTRQRREAAALLDALRSSERRYRELFEAIPDAVLVLDRATHTIHDANTAVETIYGWPRSELIGQPATILGSRGADRVDRRRDGTEFAIEVHAAYLETSDPPLVVEVIRDVSERERAAAERHALEEQVRQTQKLEAVGRLAAGVAHDFANLLQVIISSALFVTEAIEAAGGRASDEIREDLATIDQACRSGTDLTRRLLAFSGRQSSKPAVIDIGEVVRELVAMLRRTLGSRVVCALEVHSGSHRALADRAQLEQVIANLVVNARDAMPEGGRLTITVAHDAKPSETVLTVSDTGVGIPADVLSQIFQPFFTTKAADRGTGLGLATVRQIVTQLGGRIDVRSVPGQGTAFEIRLPVALPSGAPRARGGALSGRGEHVLVIDDEPAVCDSMSRILATAGYRVKIAADAEEALAHVAAGAQVDLAIIDVRLPRMSGTQCAAALAAKLPALRILFASGLAPDPRSMGGVPAHAGFLSKPFDRDTLLRTLRELLDESR